MKWIILIAVLLLMGCDLERNCRRRGRVILGDPPTLAEPTMERTENE